jgi:hypothetical protein
VLSENNKFQDETDFWKISGFDHACHSLRWYVECTHFIFILSVIMLSVVELSVVMLNVLAPKNPLEWWSSPKIFT